MINWMLDVAPPEHDCDINELTKRLLGTDFAAIHTSSNVRCLFYSIVSLYTDKTPIHIITPPHNRHSAMRFSTSLRSPSTPKSSVKK